MACLNVTISKLRPTVIFFQPQHILHRDLKPANILGVDVWWDRFQEKRLLNFFIFHLLHLHEFGQ